MTQDTNTPTAATPAVSADNIGQLITAELAKVVGIEKTTLAQYAAFLGTMAPGAVAALLKTLKDDLGEQLLPLLDILAHGEQATLAELGIERLGAVQSFKAAQMLAEIDATHPDKHRCKAARKSLYRLKSAGIEVETAIKPLLGAMKHERYKALLSALDGSGTQFVMLSEEMLAGDLHLLHVIANEQNGIQECYSKRGITKKMFAKLPDAFAREGGGLSPMLVEADYDYAMTVIAAAEQVSIAAKQDVPDDYVSMKTFFGLDRVTAVPNPVYQALDAANLKEQPYFLRTAEDLFKQPTFLSWLLPVNDMGKYAQELLDQEGGVIEVSPQFQQERKEEIYQKVVDAHLGDEVVNRLRQRLEMMAYILHEHALDEDAKRALAAALHLNGLAPANVKTHPFIRRLIVDSIDLARGVLEDGYNPDEIEKDSYIVTRNDEGELIVKFIEEEK